MMAKSVTATVSSDRMVRVDGGHPLVRFDRARRLRYHLTDDGERVYHEVPVGHEFDDQGRLRPVKGD